MKDQSGRQPEKVVDTVKVIQGQSSETAATCEVVERWLTDHRGLTDNTTAASAPEASPAIAAHLETCAACQAEQDDILRLPMTVPTTTGAADPLFVRSIMAQVRREPTPTRRQRRSTLRVRAAALIALLLLPVAAFLIATGGDAVPTAPAVTVSAATVAGPDEGLATAMSVQLDEWSSDFDDLEVDVQANGGWIPALQDNDGSREIVSF